ncbi:MAG: acyl carrier protein [Candidatus Omnitrophica bacterium]|nr:acyl carrier protein [Candidatus Omnitrophota bacterium]
MNEKIRKEVIETISNLTKIPKEAIDPAISFRDAGLDSFALVEVVFSLENYYDITFPQEGLLDIVTVNELVDFIEKLLAEKEKTESDSGTKEAKDGK